MLFEFTYFAFYIMLYVHILMFYRHIQDKDYINALYILQTQATQSTYP